MPAWIAAALALMFPIAIRGAGTAGRFIRGRGGAAALGAGAGALASTVGIPGVDLFPDGDMPRRRRRRRRALTASDRADIAFITGLLGANAGKNFALTIATRT
ncbi:MAG TPA: hypothetical protein EYO33_19475 [Phycisphaerales bacterium]|nr:hypothetical protein [Phycisphaerales bacterium]